MAQKGAGRGQHTRSHLDYDEVEGIRYSSTTESLVNECLCSSDGWVALVPVEVIASAPEVELSLMGGRGGNATNGIGLTPPMHSKALGDWSSSTAGAGAAA